MGVGGVCVAGIRTKGNGLGSRVVVIVVVCGLSGSFRARVSASIEDGGGGDECRAGGISP